MEASGYQWFATYVRFLLYTGCRRNEILFLKWEDIDIHNNIITIYADKTKREFQIPINKSLQAVISKMQMKTTGYVFQTESSRKGANKKKQPWNQDYVSHLFKDFVKDAGLSDDLHLHHLRHTYATQLLQQGVHLEIVQKFLGHASPLTTAKSYDHSIALHFRDEADKINFEEDE